MKKILLLLVTFIAFFNISAQDIDSIFVNKLLLLSRENEQKQPSISMTHLDEIETYSQEHNYNRGLYKVNYERAYVLYINNKNDKALSILRNETFDLISLTPLDWARIYNLKGVIYQAKNNRDSSLFYLNESINSYKKIDNIEGIITTLNNQGMILYQANLIDAALVKFKESYDLCIKNNHFNNITEISSNYAAILVTKNKLKEALSLYESLLKKDNLSIYQKATIYINWATFLKNDNQVEESLLWFKKTINFSKENNLALTSDIYLGLGQIYLLKNNPEKALQMFNLAIDLNPLFIERKMIYKGIIDSYTKLRERQKTIIYWEELNQLIEKEYQKNTLESLAEVQNNVEALKKDFDIKLLTKDNIILTQKRNTNNYIILSLILVTVLLLSFVAWYYKRQQIIREKTQSEIKIKKQSLLTYALKVSQMNELLFELKNKVESDNISITILKKEINSSISLASRNSEDWKQFEIYFKDLYKGFYEKLKIQFPDLTTNDLRVCSLVKLRFTIKEISNLLFLSTETVKSTRYRIRKKMQLRKDDNLAEILNSL